MITRREFGEVVDTSSPPPPDCDDDAREVWVVKMAELELREGGARRAVACRLPVESSRRWRGEAREEEGVLGEDKVWEGRRRCRLGGGFDLTPPPLLALLFCNPVKGLEGPRDGDVVAALVVVAVVVIVVA